RIVALPDVIEKPNALSVHVTSALPLASGVHLLVPLLPTRDTSCRHYSARLRANAPTRPTKVAKDSLASSSSFRREASVVGSPNVSSGRRNASARGHMARSMS